MRGLVRPRGLGRARGFYVRNGTLTRVGVPKAGRVAAVRMACSQTLTAPTPTHHWCSKGGKKTGLHYFIVNREMFPLTTHNHHWG